MSEEIKIKIDKIELVDISILKNDPKNRNKHSKEQAEELAAAIREVGWTTAIIANPETKVIKAGHLRLQVAKILKLKKVPVTWQISETENIEYITKISDNEIAKQSKTDMSGIHLDLRDLAPFPIELLCIPNWQFEPDTDIEIGPKAKKETECPNCKVKFIP